MRLVASTLLGLLLLVPSPAPAQEPPQRQPAFRLHATYQVYAAGLHVAEVEATFGIGPRRYDIVLTYHTTGLVSVFRHGHQFNEVIGTWDAGRPQPTEFQAVGVWNGDDRVTLIDYDHGAPVIRRLVPPQEKEREPVPPALQRNAVDSLSALALLIRRVEDTGRCDAAVRTYDGHRATEISASTAGEEILPHTDLSDYEGRALRCDFIGRMLAGFRFQDDSPADRRPLRGAAWLATVIRGAPPVPVRMEFETRWFGDAHMYLTRLEPVPATAIATH